MKYSSIDEAVEALKTLQSKQFAYDHAMGVLYLDATTAAPSDTWEGRGKTMEVLSQASYDLLVTPENGELFAFLEENREALDPQTRREAEVLKKSYEKTQKIPPKEYVEYSILLNDAQAVWHKAKLENDFQAFAPYLEKIMAIFHKNKQIRKNSRNFNVSLQKRSQTLKIIIKRESSWQDLKKRLQIKGLTSLRKKL